MAPAPAKEAKLEQVTISCPVCDTITIQYQIRPNFYRESDPDLDTYPKKIQWLRKGFENWHPRMLYMYHCPDCCYTAGHPFFDDPAKGLDTTPVKIIKALKTAIRSTPANKPVLKTLGRDIDVAQPSNYQAVKLHLLAFYILQQIDITEKKDAINLGRYILRLAWLFRDIDQDWATKKQVQEQVDKLVETLKPHWPGCPVNEAQALKIAVKYYLVTLQKSRTINNVRE